MLINQQHRDVLDVVDGLRSKGIGRYIDLPQIIVCGDQSSGKSSVLEAISGMPFPTKDALCTRFATELILRRSPTESIKLSVVSGQGGKHNKITLSPSLKSFDFAQTVKEAQDFMVQESPDTLFFTDILRVEISSPTQPHLTLVDLPGLFVAGNKQQSVSDAEVVSSLVRSYMAQPRSIILAVVSAKSEFALQQISERAREYDPKGVRTLGLITKPDTLDEGSDSEKAYLNLALNKDVQFRLGWHVVKNRDFHQRDATKKQRDASEKLFFSSSIWSTLNPSHLGIHALTKKLGKVLHDHNLTNLPQVLGDIEKEIETCSQSLERLGESRSTPQEQRRYLFNVSREFTAIVKAAVNGDYSDRTFFGALGMNEGADKRLRAQVNNELTEFATNMRIKGHSSTIIDDDEWEKKTRDQSLKRTRETLRRDMKERGENVEDESAEDESAEDESAEDESAEDGSAEDESASSDECDEKDEIPEQVRRSVFVEKVSVIITRSRGRELPGTFDPLIVGSLFTTQCRPWKRLAADQVQKILDISQDLLVDAAQHVVGDEVASNVTGHIIDGEFRKVTRCVKDKLAELLKPHFSGHPITFNHYLTENIQKVQQARNEKRLQQTLESHFGGLGSVWTESDSSVSKDSSSKRRKIELNRAKLFTDLLSDTQPDMGKYAATTAVDTMEAYYKVWIEMGLLQGKPQIPWQTYTVY